MPEGSDAKSLLQLVVLSAGPAHDDEAEGLADHLGAGLRRGDATDVGDDLALLVDEGGLALAANGMVLRPDLSRMAPRLRAQALSRELLVRAARLKGARGPLTAVDATAGLGEDALLLAAAGFTVTLFESDPVIAALLRDSLRRAAWTAGLTEIVGRMRAVEADSVTELARLAPPPDVVYLDPMFPERRKSAATKKKFQLIHLLERPCANPEELMAAALAARPRKVVVKRPLKGPFLAGVRPSHSVEGKVVRYDCVVPPQGPRVDEA